MAWLQIGRKIVLLPSSRTSIRRPEPGNRPGILQVVLVQDATRVRIDTSTKFQQLRPCFQVCRTQWRYSSHTTSSSSSWKSTLVGPDLEKLEFMIPSIAVTNLNDSSGDSYVLGVA